MIRYQEGNLFDSKADVLVNTVNTVGVMGKGIALQFKERFIENNKAYKKACKEGSLTIGKLLIVDDNSQLDGRRTIVNFPTKTDWRKPSEYSYIESGLRELSHLIVERNIKSIAIPPLGSGNGGLSFDRVKILMEEYLKDIDCDIVIYIPSKAIQEKMKKERANLTPARAMLLAVLYDLVREGEFVSEFAAEKVAYFLQRFGAEEQFKLRYEPQIYGPYSGRVRRVLFHLNGSYISGYSAMDKKPFEELGIQMDTETDVIRFLSEKEHEQFKKIVFNTKEFLSGFYSSFALELLSTVDFIAQQEKIHLPDAIKSNIDKWSQRKAVLFANPKHIDLAIKHLAEYRLLSPPSIASD